MSRGKRAACHRSQGATGVTAAAAHRHRRGARRIPVARAGFYDGPINLTDMLIDDQAAMFILRAAGDSMLRAGISSGDEILVD